MGLGETMLKVAIGVAVAKGVSTLVKGAGSSGTSRSASRDGGLGDIMDGIGGSQRPAPRQAPSGGGLGDLLGELTGGSSQPRTRRSNAPKGGLEDMLGGGQSGGLGDLLGQLTGASQNQPQTRRSAPQQGGGLGDLLGQLTGATGAARGAAQGGGLGDLLGQLTGGGAGGTSGGGLGDLLGAVLGGGAAGGAMGGLGGAEPDSRQQDLAAALILRAMVQAVKADGKLDDEERRKLTAQMDGATDEEVAYVQAELDRDIDVNDLAAQVPEGMEAQIYVMSLMAIDLDNRKEADYLNRLAQALALEPQQVNALHDRAGVQPLYN